MTVVDNPALDNFTCTPATPVASLDPGATIVCTGEHSITQNDLNAGSFKDTGTADSDETEPVDAPDTVYANQNLAIDVEKYVSVDGGENWVDADTVTGPYMNAGIAPQFKFWVKNIGNVDLTNVDVTDDVFGNIHLDGTLAVGASAEYFVTGTWAEGQHTNTATATGDFVDGNGNTQTATDTDAAHYYGSNPEIDVEKYVSIDGGTTWVDADTVTGPYMNAGIAPQFKFVVSNIGNVDLTNVDVTDDVFGNIHLDGTLAVGASAEYFVTGTWAAGQHTNTATATGDFVDSSGYTDTDTDTDDANYYGAAPRWV